MSLQTRRSDMLTLSDRIRPGIRGLAGMGSYQSMMVCAYFHQGKHEARAHLLGSILAFLL